jgi:RNA polymerase sigma-70 factor (ECF subfamily)
MAAGLRGDIEVEDVQQETLLTAFQSIGRFQWQGEDSFFRWLAGIAENSILRFADQRRRKRCVRLEREVAASGPSPSRALRREERLERLDEALKGLSPEHRQVILLARVEGLPVKEIAKRLDRSPNAVAQLLCRALKKLRASFGDTESLHLPERGLGEGRGEGGGDDR